MGPDTPIPTSNLATLLGWAHSTGATPGFARAEVTPRPQRLSFSLSEVANGFTISLHAEPYNTYIAKNLEELIIILKNIMPETQQDPASTDAPVLREVQPEGAGAGTELDNSNTTNQPA